MRTTSQVLLYTPDGLDYEVKNRFHVSAWLRVWVYYIFHLSDHLQNFTFSQGEDKEREGLCMRQLLTVLPLPQNSRGYRD